ncbi:UNVERIFIED_CONTAM: K(+)/H(+) antiporter, partial [Siphonaria sp. JEL0065]
SSVGFAIKLVHQIEDLVRIVFLPLFFAYSGLNTRLELLDDAKSWGFVLLVCVIACLGKVVGCTVSARFSGLNWRESSAVGVLMNTRGLVEIIVLNIGLNAGVITPKIFAMFVLMAIFTTLLTVPLISVVYPASYYSDTSKQIEGDKEASTNSSSSSNNNSELRALVCLPAMKVVPSMLAFSALLAGSKTLSSFSVFALRLVTMDERITTVAKFAANDTNEDAVLNAFQSISALHGYESQPLLQFAEASGSTDAILEASKQSLVNLVVIPQVASTGGNAVGKGLSWIGDDVTHKNRQMALDVSNTIDASVVHFIDRGFMIPRNEAIKGSSVSTVSIALIISGLAESSEADAIRLVMLLTTSETVSQATTFNVQMFRLASNDHWLTITQLDRPNFNPQTLYVAFSRVRKLKWIRLPSKLTVVYAQKFRPPKKCCRNDSSHQYISMVTCLCLHL